MNANLNFNQLRSFLLVAEEGNLTRAAERRHTTPSAVSTHLQQLEEQLGVVLFERTRRGMNLTSAGERLLDPARRVMTAARDLGDAAARLNGDTTRNLRLGLNAPPEHLRVGPLMAATARGEPPLVIQLESSMSERILVDVAAGRLDAGFAYGAVDDPNLARVDLGKRTLRVAAPGDFALERLPDEPAERAALPWIWPGVEGCPFRHLMPTVLGTDAHEANIVTRIDGEESIRALIRIGMGVGLLEERYALEAAGDGRLKVLEQRWEIDLSLVHRRDRADDPVIRALVSALEAAWREPEGSSA
ncbi:MAG: LysR family transcriptional regulator [Halofilum sp. (in: g-proteobacteria)]|nr:LysR family transcriptional regulator [Halofilum sp. (in: g-proteobacteria)]